MTTKRILLDITSITCPSNKIRSRDYLTSNHIQIDQISHVLHSNQRFECWTVEVHKSISYKTLNLNYNDAIHNLDSWKIPWDRFVLDGDIK